MILVDDAGGAWPGINHAPWLGVTVADFVMPAFLFIVGVSTALVFKVQPKISLTVDQNLACFEIQNNIALVRAHNWRLSV
jgi:heparan-alpha-glucosaminide N-acetyltransferase